MGSIDFVTLRVGKTGNESVPHASLSAGDWLPVRVAESDYSIHLFTVDKTAGTDGARISRNSEFQEKKGE